MPKGFRPGRAIDGKYVEAHKAPPRFVFEFRAFGTGDGDPHRVSSRVLGMPYSDAPGDADVDMTTGKVTEVPLDLISIGKGRLVRGRLARASKTMGGKPRATGDGIAPIVVVKDATKSGRYVVVREHGEHRVTVLRLHGHASHIPVLLVERRKPGDVAIEPVAKVMTAGGAGSGKEWTTDPGTGPSVGTRVRIKRQTADERRGLVAERKRKRRDAMGKGSDDQSRDDLGQWTSGGGGPGSTPSSGVPAGARRGRVGAMAGKVADKLKTGLRRLVIGGKLQAQDSWQAVKTGLRAVKGETVSDDDRKQAMTALKDLGRAALATGILAAPGGAVALAIVEKAANALGGSVVPTRFRKAAGRAAKRDMKDEMKVLTDEEWVELAQALMDALSEMGKGDVEGHEFHGNQWTSGGGSSVVRGNEGWNDSKGDPLPAADQERLKVLRLPPAWTDVRLNPNATAALQAIGKDSKGRDQYVYSAEHSERAAAEKFERLKAFNKELPSIRDRIAADLKDPNLSPQIREAALVTHLISQTGLRVGSDSETGADKKAYGATTLRAEHVTVKGDSIELKFVGKKGVSIEHTFENHVLAREMEKRVKAGGRLFNTTDAAVRDYLRSRDGDFKVKDFRTWHGTNVALREVDRVPIPKTDREYRAAQSAVCKIVAAHLGNTPSVARESYIAPAVWSRWEGSRMKKAAQSDKDRMDELFEIVRYEGRQQKWESMSELESSEDEPELHKSSEDPTMPKPMVMQTIIISKKTFDTEAKAAKWLKDHGFTNPGVDETADSFRFRQRDPGDFEDGSFRTIDITDDVKGVVGKLKQVATKSADDLSCYASDDDLDKGDVEGHEFHGNQWTGGAGGGGGGGVGGGRGGDTGPVVVQAGTQSRGSFAIPPPPKASSADEQRTAFRAKIAQAARAEFGADHPSREQIQNRAADTKGKHLKDEKVWVWDSSSNSAVPGTVHGEAKSEAYDRSGQREDRQYHVAIADIDKGGSKTITVFHGDVAPRGGTKATKSADETSQKQEPHQEQEQQDMGIFNFDPSAKPSTQPSTKAAGDSMPYDTVAEIEPPDAILSETPGIVVGNEDLGPGIYEIRDGIRAMVRAKYGRGYWVEEVYPETGFAILNYCPPMDGDAMVGDKKNATYRVPYEFAADGTVMIGTAERVQRKIVYEAVEKSVDGRLTYNGKQVEPGVYELLAPHGEQDILGESLAKSDLFDEVEVIEDVGVRVTLAKDVLAKHTDKPILRVSGPFRVEEVETIEYDLTPMGDADEMSKQATKGIVYLLVAEPKARDTQGEHEHESDIEDSAHEWMAKGHPIKIMHQGRVTGDIVVENHVTQVDGYMIGKTVLRKGSWFVGIKLCPESKAGFENGKLTGASMGGWKTVVGDEDLEVA